MTVTFQAALRQAEAERKHEGKRDFTSDVPIRALLRNPVVRGKDGREDFLMRRAERRVRRMYQWEQLKQGRFSFFSNIDWGALVQWIKDHWVEIAKTILVIIPFLI